MDEVFKALADPTRRGLLDELFEAGGQTLSALEGRLPMTRFGVMKHLRVLEEAGADLGDAVALDVDRRLAHPLDQRPQLGPRLMGPSYDIA